MHLCVGCKNIFYPQFCAFLVLNANISKKVTRNYYLSVFFMWLINGCLMLGAL